jgi:biopolymer transport protein TolR
MANPSSLRGGRTRKFKSEINVVPYIDVMLVLLIIFMVVAPMTTPGAIDLPTAEKSNLPPTEYIQISLAPGQRATIGIQGAKRGGGKAEAANNPNDLLGKLAALHERHPDMPVLIAADKDIKYEEVIRTISEAKKIGIQRVGLATKG